MDSQQKKIFFDVFAPSLPRLGPGTPESTQRVLSTVLDALPQTEAETINVLDLGCGNGAQALELAKNKRLSILSLDTHKPFIDELNRRVAAAGVADRLKARVGDMAAPELEGKQYDIIWAEGSLYSMGVRNALETYRDVLKPGGCFALSELTYFAPDVPDECRNYFLEMYPPMTDIATNLAMIESCGYQLLDHFSLPESAWLEEFYVPLEKHIVLLREQHAGDPQWEAMLPMFDKEIENYRKHGAYFGYEFYVMQR